MISYIIYSRNSSGIISYDSLSLPGGVAEGAQLPRVAAEDGVGRLAAALGAYGQSPYCAKILGFRGFDSGRILSLLGGIIMSIGGFPEL